MPSSTFSLAPAAAAAPLPPPSPFAFTPPHLLPLPLHSLLSLLFSLSPLYPTLPRLLPPASLHPPHRTAPPARPRALSITPSANAQTLPYRNPRTAPHFASVPADRLTAFPHSTRSTREERHYNHLYPSSCSLRRLSLRQPRPFSPLYLSLYHTNTTTSHANSTTNLQTMTTMAAAPPHNLPQAAYGIDYSAVRSPEYATMDGETSKNTTSHISHVSPRQRSEFANRYNASQYHQQLRPMKGPMYVPAVLRPTEKPARQSPPRNNTQNSRPGDDSWSAIVGAEQLSASPPSSSGITTRTGVTDLTNDELTDGPVTGLPSTNHWKVSPILPWSCSSSRVAQNRSFQDKSPSRLHRCI